MKLGDVFQEALITEKAISAGSSSVYTFEVASNATKPMLAEAIESIYKVKVAQVRVLNRKGKLRKVGRKMKYKRLSDRKIAMIKLESGTIPVLPTK